MKTSPFTAEIVVAAVSRSSAEHARLLICVWFQQAQVPALGSKKEWLYRSLDAVPAVFIRLGRRKYMSSNTMKKSLLVAIWFELT